MGSVHACTLYPVSQPHNAQGASRAGSQGPLMPVPSGRPCQVLEGQLKKPDSVLGHSQALFLSQGGKRDSPPVNGGPWRERGENRALTVPRGLPTQLPAPTGPSWHGLAQAFDKEGPVQRQTRKWMVQGSPALTHTHESWMKLPNKVLKEHRLGPKGGSLGIPCIPHMGMSLAGRDGPLSHPAPQHLSRVAPNLNSNSVLRFGLQTSVLASK